MIVPDTTENARKCICLKCPSFPKDCKEETLYCARGKSDCEIEARSCVCIACPIYLDYSLKDLYFCDKENLGRNKIVMRKKRVNESPSSYQEIVDIKEVATTGRSVVCSMGSLKRLPFTLDDLHFIPAQVYRIPVEQEDKVNTEVTIGPKPRSR